MFVFIDVTLRLCTQDNAFQGIAFDAFHYSGPVDLSTTHPKTRGSDVSFSSSSSSVGVKRSRTFTEVQAAIANESNAPSKLTPIASSSSIPSKNTTVKSGKDNNDGVLLVHFFCVCSFHFFFKSCSCLFLSYLFIYVLFVSYYSAFGCVGYSYWFSFSTDEERHSDIGGFSNGEEETQI